MGIGVMPKDWALDFVPRKWAGLPDSTAVKCCHRKCCHCLHLNAGLDFDAKNAA